MNFVNKLYDVKFSDNNFSYHQFLLSNVYVY